ncbi:MAG TPA: translesion error-prone DNA polymerase V autoproteolytic subunit [Candidatus Acidoferrum sp.]|nr:translesion error-prone DNA polymerase V autoproteolytic subunit [Candidatus Acidoferrum sp.]
MKVELLKPRFPASRQSLPVYAASVPAGFPSPADDYIADWLDLNEHLIKHPAATFFARASGTSMVEAGIMDKALLIVDRSLKPKQGDVVIAAVNGELTCKLLDKRRKQLCAAAAGYPPIPLDGELDLVVHGVVTFVVNRLCSHW